MQNSVAITKNKLFYATDILILKICRRPKDMEMPRESNITWRDVSYQR
jgi:hypothetical protein